MKRILAILCWLLLCAPAFAAGEIEYEDPALTGQTLYVTLTVISTDADNGLSWAPGSNDYITYTSTRDTFDIVMSEVGTTGRFTVSLPTHANAINKKLRVKIYQDANDDATPSHTNDIHWADEVGYWNGTTWTDSSVLTTAEHTAIADAVGFVRLRGTFAGSQSGTVIELGLGSDIGLAGCELYLTDVSESAAVLKRTIISGDGDSLTLDASLSVDAGDTFVIVSGSSKTNRALPNATPATNGGLGTVNASNQVAGVQGTLNTFDAFKTDVLDGATDGETMVRNAMTEQGYTPARGAKLDNADVAVSTRLGPTVSGRTLDVTATGAAGIDWANVENKTTSNALTNTSFLSSTTVANVTNPVTAGGGNQSFYAGFVTQDTGQTSAAAGSAAAISQGSADPATMWSYANRTLTELDEDNTTIDLNGSAIGLDAAGIRTAVGLSSANLDTQIGTLATASALGTVDTNVDTALTRIGTPAGASLAADIGTRASQASVDDLPTVSEFNARTLASADYFDPATDIVANVTTVATLTGHTPQTGDAFARLGAPAGASIAADIATRSTQTSVDDIPTTAEIAAALEGIEVDLTPVQTVVDAIQDVTDKLATALEVDGVVWRWTANALETTPPVNLSPEDIDTISEALSGFATTERAQILAALSLSADIGIPKALQFVIERKDGALRPNAPIVKDAGGETVEIAADFRKILADNDAIQTINEVSLIDDPGDETITSPAFSDIGQAEIWMNSAVKFTIADGTAGDDDRIRVRVTTVGGNVHSVPCTVRVRDGS